MNEKAKNFSKVANEIEKKCQCWLEESKINEEIFLTHLNSDGLDINWNDTNGFVYVSFEEDGRPFVLPFIWHGLMDINKANFYVDTMLMMYHLLGKVTNEKNKKLFDRTLLSMKEYVF